MSETGDPAAGADLFRRAEVRWHEAPTATIAYRSVHEARSDLMAAEILRFRGPPATPADRVGDRPPDPGRGPE
jgi:hypothetical protein